MRKMSLREFIFGCTDTFQKFEQVKSDAWAIVSETFPPIWTRLWNRLTRRVDELNYLVPTFECLSRYITLYRGAFSVQEYMGHHLAYCLNAGPSDPPLYIWLYDSSWTKRGDPEGVKSLLALEEGQRIEMIIRVLPEEWQDAQDTTNVK